MRSGSGPQKCSDNCWRRGLGREPHPRLEEAGWLVLARKGIRWRPRRKTNSEELADGKDLDVATRVRFAVARRFRESALIVATVGAYSENGTVGADINPRRVRLIARRR